MQARDPVLPLFSPLPPPSHSSRPSPSLPSIPSSIVCVEWLRPFVCPLSPPSNPSRPLSLFPAFVPYLCCLSIVSPLSLIALSFSWPLSHHENHQSRWRTMTNSKMSKEEIKRLLQTARAVRLRMSSQRCILA